MDFFLGAVALVAVGIVIGMLSGLLGVGGGTVMVPVFRLILGLSPLGATATSLFTVVPTSISGAITHVRNRTCVVSLGVAAGIGGAFFSPVGVWLAQISPGWAVMTAAALIVAWSAYKMFRKAYKLGKHPKATDGGPDAKTEAKVSSVAGAPAGSTFGASTDTLSSGVAKTAASTNAKATSVVTATSAAGTTSANVPTSATSAADAQLPPRRKLSRKQLILGALIGMAAGVASGYVGVGGGFLMVPLFLSLANLTMHEASGTSLVGVMILAIPGVVQHALYGNIDYLVGICVALGSVPGAVLGAKLGKRVPERALTLIFGCFLLVAAVLLIVNEVG